MGRIKNLAVVAVAGVALLVTTSAQAVVLPNHNTTVTTSANNADITQWTVDGTNQYVGGTGSWFYRVGAGPIIDLGSLAIFGPVVQTSPTSDPFDTSPTTVSTTYQDTTNGLQFAVNYQVTGGNPGSKSSTIQAQLTASLLRTSNGTVLSIFELNDLAVNNTETNDIVIPSAIDPGSKVNQSDPATVFGESATSKTVGPGDLLVSNPTHREAGLFGNVDADVAAGLLNDTPAGGTSIGPANVAYAYQYNYTLISGTPTAIVEIDVQRNLIAAAPTSAVPEPVSATLSLLGLGVLSLVAGRRSKLA